jgi:cell cycle sensor histidine kinase DivJ
LRNLLLHPVRAYLDGLLHVSARNDSLVAARHRAFFATRLMVGLAAVAVFPVYLAWRGAPAPLEVLAFAAMLLPLLLVWYLSRTGKYERAHLVSALGLAALLGAIGSVTGGIASFVVPWIVVIALEASLSASRRLIHATIAIAAFTASALWAAGFAGLLPQSLVPNTNQSWALLFGAATAALYAGGIALANSAFVREGLHVKQASEARYRLLAQNMSDVIARHGRDGAITFVSPAAEQLIGVPSGELLGHRFFDRVHVSDRPAFLTAISDAARNNEPVSLEYRLRRDLPEPAPREMPRFVWVEMRSHAIDTASASGPRQVVSVIRDISARKAAALALEDARREAERANDAKSQFLATVSHELRTPLNAIIGFSEMLAREDEMKLDGARRQDYARLIRDSGEHLLAVVNGILDMSRIEAGHFQIVTEPFALKPLIESCRKMMSLRAEQSGIQLFADVAAELPEINADQRALRQVLLNLLANAIKFTERGGKVDIVARANADEIELIVSDTGVGIPEADLARLGDPFFQGRSAYDRDYEGTGLGLSVVMGLVKLHGGNVEIESRLRKGTKVLVRLPLDCQPRVKTANPQAQIAQFPQRPQPGRDNPENQVKKSA